MPKYSHALSSSLPQDAQNGSAKWGEPLEFTAPLLIYPKLMTALNWQRILNLHNPEGFSHAADQSPADTLSSESRRAHK